MKNYTCPERIFYKKVLMKQKPPKKLYKGKQGNTRKIYSFGR